MLFCLKVLDWTRGFRNAEAIAFVEVIYVTLFFFSIAQYDPILNEEVLYKYITILVSTT